MRFLLVVVALLAAPGAVSAQDYDCSDFASQAEAQLFFEQAGPGDPHRLDRDNDGVTYETQP